ncbi:putative RNA-binding protein 18 [Silurus asotus]|uniref:Probable RNA-binding protein 18 n=1 Tax=Silurus asotus TaxID=30991 RepID=A0AAD5AR96_SILAS|nr:putative RNA-binding protein 18 [Silurus asotus]
MFHSNFVEVQSATRVVRSGADVGEKIRSPSQRPDIIQDIYFIRLCYIWRISFRYIVCGAAFAVEGSRDKHGDILAVFFTNRAEKDHVHEFLRSSQFIHSEMSTKYHLVKLLEKFGKVKQFDFLFHKSGPMEGQPRGYCFVNFHTKEEAERAIQCLNGKLALSKKLVVRWAHAQRFEPFRGDKNLPASLEPSCSEAEEQPTSLSSVSAKIKAIEAKLQMMEENVDEEYAGPSPYLYNKPPEKKDKRSQPYHKQFRRKNGTREF